jgi:hypothetical protein
MASQVSVPPMRHASTNLISRLRIELTGEPVSLRSIFVPHILNVATLQNKLSKLGTKAYQVQYRGKNIKVRDGVDFHTYQLLRRTTIAQHFWRNEMCVQLCCSQYPSNPPSAAGFRSRCCLMISSPVCRFGGPSLTLLPF